MKIKKKREINQIKKKTRRAFYLLPEANISNNAHVAELISTYIPTGFSTCIIEKRPNSKMKNADNQRRIGNVRFTINDGTLDKIR